MNSQDPDFDLRLMDQYYWVKSKLDEAVRLRDNEKKIDWIIVMMHKPLYTLKGQHKPERKARDVYQPLFDQYQVDFVLHGHSHNMQRTCPIKYGGLDNDPVITASDWILVRIMDRFILLVVQEEWNYPNLQNL